MLEFPQSLSEYWSTCMSAFEAWERIALATVNQFGHVSRMMLPASDGGTSETPRPDDVSSQMRDIMRRAMEMHRQVETMANRAYASGLDASCCGFRELEAATIDRGTVDLTLIEVRRRKARNAA